MCGIELDLTSVSESELTWFLWGGRILLDFIVWIDINLGFVSGGIEIDLILIWVLN